LPEILLRGGLEVEDPLDTALDFLEAYPSYDSYDPAASTFDESDLRHANSGGARISAAEQAAILERRGRIERALGTIEPGASLMDRVPWAGLTRLFEAFGGIRGVGFSKMTKALHRKRPALIPMLDSVVQDYLGLDAPATREPESFGERAVALVRSYKRELDRNRSALRHIGGELESRGYRLTEVRILDVLIWSAMASTDRSAGATRSRSRGGGPA
jgi:hypothetical protein